MKPLRVPADAARIIKDYLAAEMPPYIAAPDPAFSLNLPGTWTKSSAPHVGVFDDSGPARWPIITQPTIRVTVWSNGRSRSNAIAGICMGVLLANHVADGLTVRPQTVIAEAIDPNNGAHMASFTAAVTARTVAVEAP